MLSSEPLPRHGRALCLPSPPKNPRGAARPCAYLMLGAVTLLFLPRSRLLTCSAIEPCSHPSLIREAATHCAYLVHRAAELCTYLVCSTIELSSFLAMSGLPVFCSAAMLLPCVSQFYSWASHAPLSSAVRSSHVPALFCSAVESRTSLPRYR
jgi:hypothetical protein